MRLYATIAATTILLTPISNVRAETFSLSIVDPLRCADQQYLIKEVTARAANTEFLESGGRFIFRVQFDRSSGKIVAELQIGSPNTPLSTRIVDGESCRDVTSAVALIIALALDPRTQSADTQPEGVSGADTPPATESPTTAELAPALSAQSPASPADEVPADSNQLASGTTVERTPRADPPAVGNRPDVVEGDFVVPILNNSPWLIGIGAEVQWTNMFTRNGGMWLIGLRVEAKKTSRLFTAIQASLGPRVVRDDGRGATAASNFYGAGVELGTPIVGSHHFATDAMAVASIGALHASGIRQGAVTNSRDATTTWIGLGPGLRLRWFSETATLAFQTTIPINVVRPRFVFQGTDRSEQEFYRAPPGGIFFGLSGTWNVGPSTDAQRMIKEAKAGD